MLRSHLAATDRGDRLQQRPAGLDPHPLAAHRPSRRGPAATTLGRVPRSPSAREGRSGGPSSHRPDHPAPGSRPSRASTTPRAVLPDDPSHHGATDPQVPPPRFRPCPPRQRGPHGRHDGVAAVLLPRRRGSWVGVEGQLHGPTVCRRTGGPRPPAPPVLSPVLSAGLIRPLANPARGTAGRRHRPGPAGRQGQA